ncbi:MAG: aldose epimerase family protein [Planctomycetaceae bacterium]
MVPRRHLTSALCSAATALLAASPLFAAAEPFGKTAEGTPVEAYTLTNDNGMSAKLITRGATLVELHVPDKNGKTADVTLGFDDVAGYESDRNQYFGCATGRVANRIAGGKFKLEGVEYKVPIKNGPNALHGGVQRSLDKVIWSAHEFHTRKGQGVGFEYTSPDGEEGFPGELKITITYVLTDDNELRIAYRATTNKPTPVNVTNHAYFNLSGAGTPTVLDHVLQISADTYTPNDPTQIPTGEIKSVAGTPLDFRTPHRIGERIDAVNGTEALGYDHNFVVNGKFGGEPRPCAIVKDPASGRVMTVTTNSPAVQLYTGNHLFDQAGKNGKTYPKQSALCLETQHYPDSVNHDNFPTTILQPGQTYSYVTVYAFSNE